MINTGIAESAIVRSVFESNMAGELKVEMKMEE